MHLFEDLDMIYLCENLIKNFEWAVAWLYIDNLENKKAITTQIKKVQGARNKRIIFGFGNKKRKKLCLVLEFHR